MNSCSTELYSALAFGYVDEHHNDGNVGEYIVKKYLQKCYDQKGLANCVCVCAPHTDFVGYKLVFIFVLLFLTLLQCVVYIRN